MSRVTRGAGKRLLQVVVDEEKEVAQKDAASTKKKKRQQLFELPLSLQPPVEAFAPVAFPVAAVAAAHVPPNEVDEAAEALMALRAKFHLAVNSTSDQWTRNEVNKAFVASILMRANKDKNGKWYKSAVGEVVQIDENSEIFFVLPALNRPPCLSRAA